LRGGRGQGGLDGEVCWGNQRPAVGGRPPRASSEGSVVSYPGSAEGEEGGGGDHAHEPPTGPSDRHGRRVRNENEIRNVLVEEPRKNFSQTGSFNPAAIDEVPLREEQKLMDKPLEDAAVSRATRKLADGRFQDRSLRPWLRVIGDAGLNSTRTRTNTNPKGTEANAAGRSVCAGLRLRHIISAWAVASRWCRRRFQQLA
jgi:hypothetical protein